VVIIVAVNLAGPPEMSLQSVADAMEIDGTSRVESPPGGQQTIPTKRSREGSPEEAEISPTKLLKG
jgi:hypothetical protein